MPARLPGCRSSSTTNFLAFSSTEVNDPFRISTAALPALRNISEIPAIVVAAAARKLLNLD
jgi:hypothetical protein